MSVDSVNGQTGVVSLTAADIPDAASQAALAAPAGSSLVGFIQPGATAIPRTALAKMREVISVLDFGATGGGSVDDTAAIQKALDYAVTIGALAIYFPAGTYIVSSSATNDYILKIKSPNLSVFGDGMHVSVIKVVAGVESNYLGILGSRTQGTNWSIENICFDHNQAGNSQGDEIADYESPGRYSISCYPALSGPDNIVINNVKVINSDSVVAFYFPQNMTLAKRVVIRGCQFIDVNSALALNYDQSIINIACDEAIISDNLFSGLTWDSPPRTAIETHAGKIVVTGNVINTFQVGMNITGMNSVATDDDVVVANNAMVVCRAGIYLWSAKKNVSDTDTVGLRNARIGNNVIDHRWDLWPTAYSTADRRLDGISFFNAANSLEVDNISISNNLISYAPASAEVDRSMLGLASSTAISIYCSQTQSMQWQNISIFANQIKYCPNCPLIIEFGLFNALQIRDNTLVDCGGGHYSVASPYAAHQIYLTPSLDSDVQIDNNAIFNNEATTTIGPLFYARDRATTSHRFIFDGNTLYLADALHVSVATLASIYPGTTNCFIRGSLPYSNIALPVISAFGSEIFYTDTQQTKRVVGSVPPKIIGISTMNGFPMGMVVQRGDIDYNYDPTPGGSIGTVVTTAGIIGSTAVVKNFGAIDA